ncbi:hypothetical protein MNBD_GAMMA09-1417 [hydrothermal vent metagenome]|uniref:Neuromedin U n=1 Tax=hydrothermal vent metagenome TaxID=652676 RepID=A0A3B0YPI3_9ZZZZ
MITNTRSSHAYKLNRPEGYQLHVSFLIAFFALSSCTLALAAPKNIINNPSQIDTPEELRVAESEPNKLSSDDLARELNNPNTPLAKLTIEYTTTAFDGNTPGAGNENVNVILFKPVFPFPLNGDGTKNFFFRPVLAYAIEQPIFDSSEGRFKSRSGLGDMGFDLAVGQTYDSGLILVGGLQGTLPIGSDDLTGDQYRLGPEFIVSHFNASRVLAAFPAHQWDVSGGGSSYSKTTLELFALKFLPGGWTVGTQPKMSYDWKADQATIPLNLTVRKVVRLGNMPVQLSAGFDYYVEKNNDFGPDFGFIFSITPVVSNFVYEWFQ